MNKVTFVEVLKDSIFRFLLTTDEGKVGIHVNSITSVNAFKEEPNSVLSSINTVNLKTVTGVTNVNYLPKVIEIYSIFELSLEVSLQKKIHTIPREEKITLLRISLK